MCLKLKPSLRSLVITYTTALRCPFFYTTTFWETVQNGHGGDSRWAACHQVRKYIQIFRLYIFGPGGFACATRGDVAMRSLAIVITIVQSFFLSLSLFFFFFSLSSAFDPLRGISHVRNNFSPNILA